jgi:DNA-binding transcriptional LysR family regulator
MHVAQPALSRQISQLEEALGCQLFDRQKRQISLTRAGQHLYTRLPLLFDQLQETAEQVKKIASGHAITLRFGYSSAAMSNFLPSVIREIQAQLDGCEFRFVEGTSDGLLEAVLAKRLDAAFILYRPDNPLIQTLPIRADETGIILQDGHPLCRKKRVALQDLKDETLILFPRYTNPAMYDEIIFYCQKAGFSPKAIIETAPRSAAIGLVAAGQGVATIAASLRHSCVQGTVYRPLLQPGPMIRYCCIVNTDTRGQWLEILQQFITEQLA